MSIEKNWLVITNFTFVVSVSALQTKPNSTSFMILVASSQLFAGGCEHTPFLVGGWCLSLHLGTPSRLPTRHYMLKVYTRQVYLHFSKILGVVCVDIHWWHSCMGVAIVEISTFLLVYTKLHCSLHDSVMDPFFNVNVGSPSTLMAYLLWELQLSKSPLSYCSVHCVTVIESSKCLMCGASECTSRSSSLLIEC